MTIRSQIRRVFRFIGWAVVPLWAFMFWFAEKPEAWRQAVKLYKWRPDQ